MMRPVLGFLLSITGAIVGLFVCIYLGGAVLMLCKNNEHCKGCPPVFDFNITDGNCFTMQLLFGFFASLIVFISFLLFLALFWCIADCKEEWIKAKDRSYLHV